MSLFLAIVCFFVSAALLWLACSDRYSSEPLYQALNMAHPPSVFIVRFLLAAVFAFLGVKLL